MNETGNNINIVEALRKKTEKDDIEQYLKSTIGGYTKNSVIEYLNLLGKQQQEAAETFSRNQQALFEEKECLKKDNDSLATRLSQVESEYRNLSEAIRSHDMDETGFSASDIVALKKNIAALEEELGSSKIDISRLQNQVKLQSSQINEYSLKLEQSSQEKLSLKEMLKAEMQETRKQRSMVSQLSGTLEEKCDEIKFLKSLVSDGEIANLKWKINDLTQHLAELNEAFANSSNENSLNRQTIETLIQENESLKQRIIYLSNTIGELNIQNEKLMSSNNFLSDQLGIEYKRLAALIKEKSDVIIDKLVAMRSLDEANTKITMLELQIKGYTASEEMMGVQKCLNKTEEIQGQDIGAEISVTP